MDGSSSWNVSVYNPTMHCNENDLLITCWIKSALISAPSILRPINLFTFIVQLTKAARWNKDVCFWMRSSTPLHSSCEVKKLLRVHLFAAASSLHISLQILIQIAFESAHRRSIYSPAYTKVVFFYALWSQKHIISQKKIVTLLPIFYAFLHTSLDNYRVFWRTAYLLNTYRTVHQIISYHVEDQMSVDAISPKHRQAAHILRT